MHKFLNNSVKKLKYLNFQNLVTQKKCENVVDCTRIQSLPYSDTTKKFKKGNVNALVNFNEIITTRRAQARKSILVQVNSEKSYSELQKYCSQYGTITGAHHYTVINDEFILVEYSDELEAKRAIDQSTFHDTPGAHVRSSFLWFRAAPNSPNRNIVSNNCKVNEKLIVTDGCQPIDYSEIYKIMFEAETLADQMLILYRTTALNDLGIRLRFLAARQIEESVSSIFPNAQACIFGSSVNGYGKLGCDLDMILQLGATDSEAEPSKRLVFHTKRTSTNSRSQIQRTLENLSDTMQMFLPGVCHVRRILQARVPIIRYSHQHLNLEIDLSMNNMSGVYMSELLYMFTQIDERVSPLMFSIRRWAQACGLTNASPGVWISNFSLTCLVIFYLQQIKKPVLPSINSLVEQARPQDKRVSDDGDLQCTFLRDLNSLEFTKQNNDSLDRLLIGFFEFYSQVNFSERAISLSDGKLCNKPDHSAIHIINPLEPSLNVSKNISSEECERFRTEVRNAAWLLESTNKSTSDLWGLLGLFRASANPVVKPTLFYKSRMVDVNELLDGNRKLLDNQENHTNIKFKNSHVKNAVTKIQKKARIELNALKSGDRKG